MVGSHWKTRSTSGTYKTAGGVTGTIVEKKHLSISLYHTIRNTNPIIMSVPTTQWAQVVEKTGGPVEYKQIPVAKPGPDEILINVKYSGVCHTDLHAVNGDWPLPTKLPLVGGHEGAGVVVAMGDLVHDWNM